MWKHFSLSWKRTVFTNQLVQMCDQSLICTWQTRILEPLYYSSVHSPFWTLVKTTLSSEWTHQTWKCSNNLESHSSIYEASAATVVLSLEVLRFEAMCSGDRTSKTAIFLFIFQFLCNSIFCQADNCHFKNLESVPVAKSWWIGRNTSAACMWFS